MLVQHDPPYPPQSPRIETVRRALESGDTAAPDAFSRQGVPHGAVEMLRLPSAILANGRRVWIYTTYGMRASCTHLLLRVPSHYIRQSVKRPCGTWANNKGPPD